MAWDAKFRASQVQGRDKAQNHQKESWAGKQINKPNKNINY